MQSDFQWFVFGLVVAIILFIMDKTVKTLPRWAVISGYALAIYLGLLGVLAMFSVLESTYAIGLAILSVIAILVALDIPIMRRVEVVERPSTWLIQTATNDLNNVAKRVFWREYRWQVNGLRQVDPYIDLHVALVNANVYDIHIEKAKDSFHIEGQECAPEAKLLSVTNIPHGESGNITIRQNLSGEMKKFMVKQGYSQDVLKVSVDSCSILVRPWVEGAKAIWVSIGNELEIPTKEFPS